MISFIAKSTAFSNNDNAGGVNYMGGILPGDLLLILALSVQEGGVIGSIDTPAGWDFVGGGVGFRDSGSNNVGTIRVFERVADGSESGFVSVTRSGTTGGPGGSTPIYCQMYQYRGTRLVRSGVASNILGDGAATIEWNSVSSPGGSTRIAMIGQLTTNPNTPSGYTNQASDSGSPLPVYLECNDISGVSGTSGTITATGGNANGWATVHINLFEAKGRNQILDS